MRPSGIIYDFRSKRNFGQTRIVLTFPLRLFYRTLHLLGTGLVVGGVGGLVFLFGPIMREEVMYRIHLLRGATQEQTYFGQLVEHASAEQQEREFVMTRAQELGAPNTSFSIVIPKIGARARVTANVSPADEASYVESLQRGVAHAAGTVFPGMEGTTFLFAHSTDTPFNIARYNAVFYLLREMEPGDTILVFFTDQFYEYRVVEKRIVDPEDTSWITNARTTAEQLVLQTCWPPGTTLKRLLVIAEPVR